MRLDLRTAAITALFLQVGIGHAFGQTADRYTQFFVKSGQSVGQGFAIKNPGDNPSCLVVTAGHVVTPGDDVALVSSDFSSSDSRPAVRSSHAVMLEKFGIDVAILKPDRPASTCDRLAGADETQKLLGSDAVGRITLISEAGTRSFMRVVVDRFNEEHIFVTAIGRDRPRKGDSGALFSINGSPIGIVISAEGAGTARLLRLDYAARVAAKYVAKSNLRHEKYDISVLPKPYQELALKVRDVSARAAAVQQEARRQETRADEAALLARARSPGYGTHRNRDYADRYYEGQVGLDSTGNPAFGEGFGILSFNGGRMLGDQLKGEFRIDGKEYDISGAAVRIYAVNDNNVDKLARFEGTYVAGAWSGYAVLTFVSGETWWVTTKENRIDGLGQALRKTDGWSYEGTFVKGQWDGPGILWDDDGQAQFIGVWKTGQLKVNESKKISAK